MLAPVTPPSPVRFCETGVVFFLEVTPAGKQFWRFRYTRPNSSQLPAAKRRNRLSRGEYPNPVSLSDARALRDGYRSDLALGINPAKKRREEAAREAIAQENSLRAIAETWFSKQAWSESHLAVWRRTLKRNVFDQVVERSRSAIGRSPISRSVM